MSGQADQIAKSGISDRISSSGCRTWRKIRRFYPPNCEFAQDFTHRRRRDERALVDYDGLGVDDCISFVRRRRAAAAFSQTLLQAHPQFKERLD